MKWEKKVKMEADRLRPTLCDRRDCSPEPKAGHNMPPITKPLLVKFDQKLKIGAVG